MNLELKALDTKPIIASFGASIVGYSFELTAHCKETDVTVTLAGQAIDTATGLFKFPRLADTFPVGMYEAEVRIIDVDGNTETSYSFYIDVDARI